MVENPYRCYATRMLTEFFQAFALVLVEAFNDQWNFVYSEHKNALAYFY